MRHTCGFSTCDLATWIRCHSTATRNECTHCPPETLQTRPHCSWRCWAWRVSKRPVPSLGSAKVGPESSNMSLGIAVAHTSLEYWSAEFRSKLVEFCMWKMVGGISWDEAGFHLRKQRMTHYRNIATRYTMTHQQLRQLKDTSGSVYQNEHIAISASCVEDLSCWSKLNVSCVVQSAGPDPGFCEGMGGGGGWVGEHRRTS